MRYKPNMVVMRGTQTAIPYTWELPFKHIFGYISATNWPILISKPSLENSLKELSFDCICKAKLEKSYMSIVYEITL